MDVLRCINKLMISENSSIFYEFDLECFIDIIVDKLNTEISIELKVLLLKTLEKITTTLLLLKTTKVLKLNLRSLKKKMLN